MPEYSAAFRAEVGKLGFDAIPIFTVAWPAPFGTELYSDRPIGFGEVGPAHPRALQADLSPSEIGLRPGVIKFPEGSIVLANRDRRLTKIMQGGVDPRGVACSFSWAAVDSSGVALAVADWHTRFSGVVDRLESLASGESVRVFFRADYGPLRGNIPKAQILQSETPLALPTSWGIYWPIIYGTLDALGLTGRGAVEAINWCFDDATSQWRYSPMLGHATAVPRVYISTNGGSSYTLGVLATDYNLAYPVVGGKVVTSIDLIADPGDNAKVACDIQGLEDVGDGTGNLIINAVEQLQHALANFGFTDHRGVDAWADPEDVPIDPVSFARCITHAGTFTAEGSIYLGGSTTATRIEDFVQEWLRSRPLYRPYWTKGAGRLGLAVLPDVRFAGYTSPGPTFPSDVDALFLRGQIHELGDSFSYVEDTSLLVRRVDIEHIYLPIDQKFFGSLALQDVSQAEDVSEAFQMPFSAARLL